jgi:hypothetical protein
LKWLDLEETKWGGHLQGIAGSDVSVLLPGWRRMELECSTSVQQGRRGSDERSSLMLLLPLSIVTCGDEALSMLVGEKLDWAGKGAPTMVLLIRSLRMLFFKVETCAYMASESLCLLWIRPNERWRWEFCGKGGSRVL